MKNDSSLSKSSDDSLSSADAREPVQVLIKKVRNKLAKTAQKGVPNTAGTTPRAISQPATSGAHRDRNISLQNVNVETTKEGLFEYLERKGYSLEPRTPQDRTDLRQWHFERDIIRLRQDSRQVQSTPLATSVYDIVQGDTLDLRQWVTCCASTSMRPSAHQRQCEAT
jgi:hypothetical protein